MCATHGRAYRLLYFVKSKNGTKCAVLLCVYVNTFILLYIFPEMAERGLQPPKSATAACAAI